MRIEQLGANTSCLPGLSLQEAIARIDTLGFRRITLLGFANSVYRFGDLAGFWFRDMSSQDRQALRDSLQGFDSITIHAPFVDLPLSSYDPKVEQLARERVEESIDGASYLGAQVVIVHANSRPNVMLQEYWNEMVSTFRELGDYAGDRGVRIGLETGYPNSVDLFVDLLEAIGHPSVGATLDVGHLDRYVDADLWGSPAGAAQLNEQLLDMVRQLGPLTIHCQLHDVDLDWRDHRAIGRGVIDFLPFLAELQQIGYDGTLEFEVEERDAIAALKESQREIETIIRRLNAGEQKAA